MRVFAIAFFGLILSACMHQTSFKSSDIREVYPPDQSPVGFERVPGLKDAIVAANREPIRLVFIHGMITGEEGYSKTSQKNIAEALGYETPDQADDIPQTAIELPRGYDVSIYDGPSWTGDVNLERAVLNRTAWPQSGQPELIAYELLWAPFRDEVKGRYFACFESKSFRNNPENDCEMPSNAKPNTSRTTWLNKSIKEGVMVRGVSDAMIVTGALGEVLKHDLSLALRTIALEEISNADIAIIDAIHTEYAKMDIPACRYFMLSAETIIGPDGELTTEALSYDEVFEDRPVFFVTESLGSYFLFRSIWDRGQLPPTESLIAENASQQVSFDAHVRDLTSEIISNATVFMFANQVSMLHLSALEPVCIPNEIEIPFARTMLNQETGEYETTEGIERTIVPCSNSRLETVESVAARSEFEPAETTYIAFNDRDDLLGYELAPYLIESGLADRLINVSVKSPAWGLPPIFRWFGSVHTNQEYNSAIIDAIVDGLSIE